MRFRPCIDIHNGRVKQIVGSSLLDAGDRASENFVSERSAASYARMFQEDGLTGGHVILLNPKAPPFMRPPAARLCLPFRPLPARCRSGAGSARKMRPPFFVPAPAM